jgi:hypothetical protein
MRCYVIATGIVFFLMFLAHLVRLFAEGPGILHKPLIVLTTVLSLGLAIWAAVLTKRPR